MATSLTRVFDSVGTSTRDRQTSRKATDVVSLAKRLTDLKAKGKLKGKLKVKSKTKLQVSVK